MSGFNFDESLPPLRLRPRRSKKTPPPPHRLRRGWRWLSVGEYAMPGDLCCDPRVMPVEIVVGWRQSSTHHPVMTNPANDRKREEYRLKLERFKESL